MVVGLGGNGVLGVDMESRAFIQPGQIRRRRFLLLPRTVAKGVDRQDLMASFASNELRIVSC